MKAVDFFKKGGTGVITVVGGKKYSLDSMAQLRSININKLIESKFCIDSVKFNWLYDDCLLDDNRNEFVVKPKQLLQDGEFFWNGGVVEVYKHLQSGGVPVCKYGDFLCTITDSYDLYRYESQHCHLDRVDYIGRLHGVDWSIAIVEGDAGVHFLSKNE